MRRIFSSYAFVNEPLGLARLGEIAAAGFPTVELFCSRRHFNYASSPAVREMAEWLAESRLEVHSLHAPTERDSGPRRDSGAPISIADLERVRRIDAVDEIKRALDVAEQIPFRFLVQHLGHAREAFDQRKLDAAFSSLEHLVVFAKQRGVTIALENTPGDLASPWNLRRFIEDTRLHGLRLCFDFGHAHLEEGVEPSSEPMRELVATSHVHDNHGEKDEHLVPGEGTIEWEAALKALAALPELPLVMELKESPERAQQLQDARAAFDRIEKTLSAQRSAAPKP